MRWAVTLLCPVKCYEEELLHMGITFIVRLHFVCIISWEFSCPWLYYQIFLIQIICSQLYVFKYSYLNKLAEYSRGRPEDSIFKSYYTEVLERALLIFLDCSTYSWSVPFNSECKARRHQVAFSSFWYNSTWDWTLVSRTSGEHSNHSVHRFK